VIPDDPHKPTAADAQDYRAAQREVSALRVFYFHATIFTLVMSLLFVINISTSRRWWVQWPLLGWGIGLLAHRLSISSQMPFLGADWERRKVLEIVERRRRSRGR
jgi:hypothetical protein